VVKCDITGTFTAGDCFQFTLSVAGETATASSAGPIYTLSKAGTKCAEACILGPSCKDCTMTEPPSGTDGEFSRSPGFYSNHPDQTNKYLPIDDVCGFSITYFPATQDGSKDGSATQALCISAKSGVSTYDYARDSLLRQLLAAKLNEKVTLAYGGSLTDADLIDSCNGICTEGTATLATISNCIDKLSQFNDDIDTLEPTPPEFADPGRAYPDECKRARDDTFLFYK
jgi:hypothetical protein